MKLAIQGYNKCVSYNLHNGLLISFEKGSNYNKEEYICKRPEIIYVIEIGGKDTRTCEVSWD